jgi:hypothetical protein
VKGREEVTEGKKGGSMYTSKKKKVKGTIPLSNEIDKL